MNLVGDAYVAFTAPFFPSNRDVRAYAKRHTPTGRLLVHEAADAELFDSALSWSDEESEFDLLAAEPSLVHELHTHLTSCGYTFGDPERITIDGILNDNGCGAIAVTFCWSSGWDAAQRERMLATCGADGREPLGDDLRDFLIGALSSVADAGGPTSYGIPYFNVTYAGLPSQPDAGRLPLDDELRCLVCPNSPRPLESCSPWRDQFFYAGHSYNLLATPDPACDLAKVAMLLMVVGDLYSQLACASEEADAGLRDSLDGDEVLSKLSTTELRRQSLHLRSTYQRIANPTFSLDDHALRLRDAIFDAWQFDRLQHRTQDVLEMLREQVEAAIAADQQRRTRLINAVVVLLTILSVVATIDSAVSLYDRYG